MNEDVNIFTQFIIKVIHHFHWLCESLDHLPKE
jgi:hypothetical protein